MTESPQQPRKRRTLTEARIHRRWLHARRPDWRTQFIQLPKQVELGPVRREVFDHRMVWQDCCCAGCQKRCSQRRRLAAAEDGKLYCTRCMQHVDPVRAYQLLQPRMRRRD